MLAVGINFDIVEGITSTDETIIGKNSPWGGVNRVKLRACA